MEGGTRRKGKFLSLFFHFVFVLFCFLTQQKITEDLKGGKKTLKQAMIYKTSQKNGKFFTQSKENAMSRHIFLNIKKT